jgi:hypothetical protein
LKPSKHDKGTITLCSPAHWRVFDGKCAGVWPEGGQPARRRRSQSVTVAAAAAPGIAVTFADTSVGMIAAFKRTALTRWFNERTNAQGQVPESGASNLKPGAGGPG